MPAVCRAAGSVEKNIDLTSRANALHQAAFKFPAGHLPAVDQPGEFIGGDSRIMTYSVNDPERFGDGNVAPMENRMGCGRLFGLAPGAASRMTGLSFAIIGVSAFTTNESGLPFPVGQKLQTFVLRREHILK